MTQEATYEHHFVTNDGGVFNMIEDESGDIFWGYGHRDRVEFVTEVNRWLVHVGVDAERVFPIADTPVEHLWAKLDDEYGERFTVVKGEGADAFPVTRLWH